MKLDIEPFKVGDLDVAEVEVKTLGFLAFAEAVKYAVDTKEYQRARLKASVRLDGKAVTDEQITLLPVRVGKAILAKLDDGAIEGGRGNVLTPDANGIDQPILYELANPIKLKTKSGSAEIKELEFHARTFGELEDVLAEQTQMQQAVVALRKLAAPVGVSSPILSEAMLQQISVLDGLTIASKVITPLVE